MVEIRGLLLHAWSEDNLKLISKKVGNWGWWINSPDTMRCLETCRICCYTSSLNRIYKGDFIRVDKVGYQLKLVDVEHDFSKGNCVLKEDQEFVLKILNVKWIK